MVEYSYSSYGEILSIDGDMAATLGEANSFRYRGYWYDSESGFYYLQSRYYDPQVGRFINGDDTAILSMTQGMILGANLFAYCQNNPVNNSDPNGYGSVGAIIGGILGFGLLALIVPRIADLLKLKGWGRTSFIWAGEMNPFYYKLQLPLLLIQPFLLLLLFIILDIGYVMFIV